MEKKTDIFSDYQKDALLANFKEKADQLVVRLPTEISYENFKGLAELADSPLLLSCILRGNPTAPLNEEDQLDPREIILENIVELMQGLLEDFSSEVNDGMIERNPEREELMCRMVALTVGLFMAMVLGTCGLSEANGERIHQLLGSFMMTSMSTFVAINADMLCFPGGMRSGDLLASRMQDKCIDEMATATVIMESDSMDAGVFAYHDFIRKVAAITKAVANEEANLSVEDVRRQLIERLGAQPLIDDERPAFDSDGGMKN